jgi:tRNA(fMet)-specific endonuclease VapC
VLAELYAWAHCSRNPQRVLDGINELLNHVAVLEFDDACARRFGELRGILRRQGAAVSSPDLLIAATALVHGFTLVSHNTAHFAKIPGLSLVDWLVP